MKIPSFLQRLISYPLGALLFIAMPITAAINLVRYWLGYEQSVVFGALTGFGSVVLTLFFQRKNLGLDARQIVADLTKPFIGPDRFMLYAVAAMGLWLFTKAPTESMAKSAADLITAAMMAIVIALALYWAARNAFDPNRGTSHFWVVMAVLRAILAGNALLCLIGLVGDELYRAIVAYPDQAVLYLMVFMAVSKIINFSLGGGRTVGVAAVRGSHTEGIASMGSGPCPVSANASPDAIGAPAPDQR